MATVVTLLPTSERRVAYFSMEIGLEPAMPTYSGGLGVLAGDTIRSGADLKVPMVAVTLVHRDGYFTQRLDESGWQHEEPTHWKIEDFLKEQSPRVTLTLEGRTVHLRAWLYEVKGVSGGIVPVYFLDSDLPENDEKDRAWTRGLYGAGQEYRFCQEVILGIGGVRMLRALGYEHLTRFHMNEGHASLLTLELLQEAAQSRGADVPSPEDFEAVRQRCVFTTHTPVPAGHDQFPMELVTKLLGTQKIFETPDIGVNGTLNMTHLALRLSHFINGVAKRHGEVTQAMFPASTIEEITNGVHAATWIAPSFQQLFDQHIPGWRQDNSSLRLALGIPKQQIWAAHTDAKKKLIEYVNLHSDTRMDTTSFTLGFARRATGYKRMDLLFHDVEALKRIAKKVGPLQIVYAGKAHPQDQTGKELIQKIFQAREALKGQINVVYLGNYDMTLGKLMTSGTDVWLNTPQPPLEASGTSGMKAAMNGVPSLSILDGWWVEGCIEGVTGWAIGKDHGPSQTVSDRAQDASLLYDQLEQEVMPLFYQHRERFIDVMRHAIALNGSFFNTQRMLQQYITNAYFR